jgi:hypothetical protein
VCCQKHKGAAIEKDAGFQSRIDPPPGLVSSVEPTASHIGVSQEPNTQQEPQNGQRKSFKKYGCCGFSQYQNLGHHFNKKKQYREHQIFKAVVLVGEERRAVFDVGDTSARMDILICGIAEEIGDKSSPLRPTQR